MLILLWILASPLSIWAMIFSISCSSLQRSQNTAAGDKRRKSLQILRSLVWLWDQLFKNAITRIFHDFLWSFSLNFSGDVLDIVPPPLLVCFDELVKVALVPDGKTLKWRSDTYKLKSGTEYFVSSVWIVKGPACTCCSRFSFSSSSSSVRASASSILACSSFWIWAEFGNSGLRGT